MHDEWTEPTVEMPRYKCHKEVHALKIKHIVERGAQATEDGPPINNGGADITPEDDGYAGFYVSESYMRKHQPKAGGYYVRYEDGYESYSPAEAFESGYTRI